MSETINKLKKIYSQRWISMKKNKLLAKYQSLYEIELAAEEKLTKDIYDYYAGGAGDELTLHRNCRAYDRFQLVPQVLSGIQTSDLSVKILGTSLAFPIIGAPMAFQCLGHEDGELATAQALNEMGLVFTCSVLSTISLEEISTKIDGSQWFQIYIFKDREITRDLIRRAESSGYRAIILTVDVPIMGYRERDNRNQFCLPPSIIAANLIKYQGGYKKLSSKSNFSAIKMFTDNQFDASLTWKDIDWLKSQTTLPIIIKGILRPSDAVKAIDYGADAIIVSNHGGRQLDSTCSTIEVVSLIAKQVKNRIPVLLDGGIRRGSDILKALAMGADSILLGRPLLWGLSLAGAEGVCEVLKILKRELMETMILCGYSSIAELKEDKELIIDCDKT
jgi:isopentenyl diphosphate isomerase/L-lactate dehydrogenase-like FMN-dependent dehydrogenase